MRWVTGALWLVTSGCIVGGGEGDWVFDGATGLFVSLGNGNVQVGSSADDLTHVEYDGGGIGRAARPLVEQDGAGLVTVDGGGGLGGGDVIASVVAGIPVTALVDAGDITIELEAPADIDACVGAGSVSIGVPAGAYALDIEAGAGSIDLEIVDDPGAPHTIHACMGAGEIDIHVYDPAAATWSR